MNGHPTREEDFDLFALGALDREEREAIESHVVGNHSKYGVCVETNSMPSLSSGARHIATSAARIPHRGGAKQSTSGHSR